MICTGSLIKGIAGPFCFDMKVYLKIYDVHSTFFNNYYRSCYIVFRAQTKTLKKAVAAKCYNNKRILLHNIYVGEFEYSYLLKIRRA